MPYLHPQKTVRYPQRRQLVHLLGLAGILSSIAPHSFATTSWANTRAVDGTQQIWRALSRVGYGPTHALNQQILAAPSPQAWAVEQIAKAADASQQPAPVWGASDMEFSGSLTFIFDGIAAERQARAAGQQPKVAGESTTKNKVVVEGNLLKLQDPEHFSRRLMLQTAAWHLTSASQPAIENPLLARLTEFWFNHLNVFVGKGSVRPFVGHYLIHVIRAHALGRFEDLLIASARHPAMLNYLDQTQSAAEGTRGGQGRVRGLNENYARELMELHTLGVNGGYTQNDVRELARVLTGWTINPNSSTGFRFASRLHDYGEKKVLGVSYGGNTDKAGEQEGIDVMRMLARHPATARHISKRLAQFFVADDPPEPLLQRLSASFLHSHGDIRWVMRTLLESPEMWDSTHLLFKTPLDYACSALTVIRNDSVEPVQGKALHQALQFLKDAGQPLHGWQTPDGYPTHASTWLAPEALTRRADFALLLSRKANAPKHLAMYLRAATTASIDKKPHDLHAGLMLASPDFMYK